MWVQLLPGVFKPSDRVSVAFAPGGSGARVTSMGGLYDAATLQALVRGVDSNLSLWV